MSEKIVQLNIEPPGEQRGGNPERTAGKGGGVADAGGPL